MRAPASKLRKLATRVLSITTLASSVECSLSRVGQRPPARLAQADLRSENELARVRQYLHSDVPPQLAFKVARDARVNPLSATSSLGSNLQKGFPSVEDITRLVLARAGDIWADVDQFTGFSEELQQIDARLQQHHLDGSAWLAEIYFHLPTGK